MSCTAIATTLEAIQPWRDLYRHEMNCQIIHDSIHARPGWTIEYALQVEGAPAGYGSVAVAGPWKDKPTIFEFFVTPSYRARAFDLFLAFQSASGAKLMEVQSNETLLFVMLHTFAKEVVTESILFRDDITTHMKPDGVVFRPVGPPDEQDIRTFELDEAKWGVETEGRLVGTGDILYHYNRPYGDIYMKIAEPFRKRGLGAYLVQELKRVCYEGGSIPGARCNPNNVASRRTLQKAGFVPVGHILDGYLSL